MDGGRRRVLLKLGGGAAILVGGTSHLLSSTSFDLVDAPRNSTIGVAAEGSGIVGVVGQGPVQKNQRESMVEFTNNGAEAITITVTLDNAGDGTLYDNQGGSGASVTFTLAAGNTQFVDIQASATGTITYSVSVSSSSLSLDTSGSVESQAGNQPGAIRIQQPSKDQDFTADRSANEFVVDKVDIRDDDNDDDLDRIEFRVREGNSGGTVVGSLDVTSPPGDRYNPNSVTIQPTAGYTIKTGTTYSLTVTALDTDGNSASETVEDTTSGTPPATPTATATPTPPPGATPTPTPANQAPTADFTTNRKGNSSNVDLDGSASSDPDGSIVSYEWDVGDDGTVDYTGQTVNKANVPQGSAVTLTVTDNESATGSVTKTVA